MLSWLQRFMFANPERERATDALREQLEKTEEIAAKTERRIDRITSEDDERFRGDPFGKLVHKMRNAQFRQRIKKEGGIH